MQDAAGTPFAPEALTLNPARTWPGRRPKVRLPAWLSGTCWAFGLFTFTQVCLVQGYQVYGCCMEPNLVTGERLLGSKLALLDGVHRGDVVVFRAPTRNVSFIKRVIGLPGETIEIRDSRVYINGKHLNEPYLHRVWHDDRPVERIAADHLFVMGDNRDNSNDSRSWGELPLENLQAKAWVRYWPLSRAEWIR